MASGSFFPGCNNLNPYRRYIESEDPKDIFRAIEGDEEKESISVTQGEMLRVAQAALQDSAVVGNTTIKEKLVRLAQAAVERVQAKVQERGDDATKRLFFAVQDQLNSMSKTNTSARTPISNYKIQGTISSMEERAVVSTTPLKKTTALMPDQLEAISTRIKHMDTLLAKTAKCNSALLQECSEVAQEIAVLVKAVPATSSKTKQAAYDFITYQMRQAVDSGFFCIKEGVLPPSEQALLIQVLAKTISVVATLSRSIGPLSGSDNTKQIGELLGQAEQEIKKIKSEFTEEFERVQQSPRVVEECFSIAYSAALQLHHALQANPSALDSSLFTQCVNALTMAAKPIRKIGESLQNERADTTNPRIKAYQWIARGLEKAKTICESAQKLDVKATREKQEQGELLYQIVVLLQESVLSLTKATNDAAVEEVIEQAEIALVGFADAYVLRNSKRSLEKLKKLITQKDSALIGMLDKLQTTKPSWYDMGKQLHVLSYVLRADYDYRFKEVALQLIHMEKLLSQEELCPQAVKVLTALIAYEKQIERLPQSVVRASEKQQLENRYQSYIANYFSRFQKEAPSWWNVRAKLNLLDFVQEDAHTMKFIVDILKKDKDLP